MEHTGYDKRFIDFGIDWFCCVTCFACIFAFALRERPPLLHRIALAGNRVAARSIVEDGYDPNFVDEYGYTALHVAAIRGDREMCRTLIVLGADRTKRDRKGRMPIHYAVLNEHPMCLNVLVTPSTLNARDYINGATPLHYAMRYKLPAASRLLVAEGASTTVQDNYDHTSIEILVIMLTMRY